MLHNPIEVPMADVLKVTCTHSIFKKIKTPHFEKNKVRGSNLKTFKTRVLNM
jgi:hypothetical protein